MLARFSRWVVGILAPRVKTVLFFASHPVDEVWIRSAAFELRKAGVRVKLYVVGELDRECESEYRRRSIEVCARSSAPGEGDLDADIIVTASSGVARHEYPIAARYLVHMPHSLASLHMIYPENAFDGYDVLFAAGPHHEIEFKRICAARALDARKMFRIGYGKLDQLRALAEACPRDAGETHVLLAPSWGPGDLLSLMGCELMTALAGAGYKVTVRPHPVLYAEKPDLIDRLTATAEKHPRICLENSILENRAMLTADVLISDFSGTAFEFAALRRRRSVFVDVEPKQVNQNWRSYGLEPAELGMRERIGTIVKPEVSAIMDGICAVEKQGLLSQPDIDEFVFDGEATCGSRAADAIKVLLAGMPG